MIDKGLDEQSFLSKIDPCKYVSREVRNNLTDSIKAFCGNIESGAKMRLTIESRSKSGFLVIDFKETPPLPHQKKEKRFCWRGECVTHAFAFYLLNILILVTVCANMFPQYSNTFTLVHFHLFLSTAQNLWCQHLILQHHSFFNPILLFPFILCVTALL